MTRNTAQSWLARELEDPEARRIFEQERLAVVAANVVAEAMEEEHVSKAELAQRLGCSRAHVTQALSGARNITLRTLADMAWALGRQVGLRLDALDAIDFRPVEIAEPTFVARKIPSPIFVAAPELHEEAVCGNSWTASSEHLMAA